MRCEPELNAMSQRRSHPQAEGDFAGHFEGLIDGVLALTFEFRQSVLRPASRLGIGARKHAGLPHLAFAQQGDIKLARWAGLGERHGDKQH